MHQKLIEIIEAKKIEVARLKRDGIITPDGDIPALRDFMASISKPGKISLIAEIKFASPSAGSIREKTDPSAIAKIYESSGASAISLLTDQKFFQGNIAYLPVVRRAISLPVLRKDFIIDDIQLKEASRYGADAALLIARILPVQQLKDLITACRELGLAPLVEIHDTDDLDKAVKCGADIIGINNRDLDTFEIDIRNTFKLAPLTPEGCILVGESGIENEDDVRTLKGTGVNAVLVGSALMKSDDIAAKTAAIVQAGL
jgi:indole-3-glycerol phosphate synthase